MEKVRMKCWFRVPYRDAVTWEPREAVHLDVVEEDGDGEHHIHPRLDVGPVNFATVEFVATALVKREAYRNGGGRRFIVCTTRHMAIESTHAWVVLSPTWETVGLAHDAFEAARLYLTFEQGRVAAKPEAPVRMREDAAISAEREAIRHHNIRAFRGAAW